METVQLAVAESCYAKALREMLLRNGNWNVLCVEVPDPGLSGVLVLDGAALERLPASLVDPERIVLITRNEPAHLARAWEAGIVSLVFENDPLNTAMLAIMAAGLRLAKDARRPAPQASMPAGSELMRHDAPVEIKPAPGARTADVSGAKASQKR